MSERELTSLRPTPRSELLRIGALLGAPHEARILLEEATGKDFRALVLDFDLPMDPASLVRLGNAVSRRQLGVPLQHIIGHWPFRTLELVVDRRALIPRPETEEVVGVCFSELERLRARKFDSAGRHTCRLLVVDLGAGSGAISCALVTEDPQVDVIAIERSGDALSLCCENIARLDDSARARVTSVQGDWFAPLEACGIGAVDLVVSNPPYLSRSEWDALDPVVRDFDPYEALVAGESGLEGLESVIAGASSLLAAHGTLVCEIGASQGDSARKLARSFGARTVEIHRDLGDRDRVLVARYGGG